HANSRFLIARPRQIKRFLSAYEYRVWLRRGCSGTPSIVAMEPLLATKSAAYRCLFLLARPYWPHLVIIFLLSLIAAPITMLLAFPLKIAVDNVVGNQALPHALAMLLPGWLQASKTGNLLVAVGLLLSLSLLMNLQSFGAWLLQTYTGEKLVLD